MAMALGPEVSPPDRPAQVEHRPRRETERTGAFLGPDRGLKGKGIVVAGEACKRRLPLAEVKGSKDEFVTLCHGERIAKP